VVTSGGKEKKGKLGFRISLSYFFSKRGGGREEKKKKRRKVVDSGKDRCASKGREVERCAGVSVEAFPLGALKKRRRKRKGKKKKSRITI